MEIQKAPIHQIFVGIDIGYKTHVACVCPGLLFNAKKFRDGWKRAKTLHFSSDSTGFKQLTEHFLKYSDNPQQFLILSEPTGGHYGLALQMYLLNKGYPLLQVGNSTVSEYRKNIYGSETKTDDMDARLMARMGFLHEWIGEEFSIQPVQIVSPDDFVLRSMTTDFLKLGKEIKRRKAQLHQIVTFTFPELKSFFKAGVAGSTARKLLMEYPTPKAVASTSPQKIAQLFHKNSAFHHEKHVNELIALAKGSSGLEVISHHLWRQQWILEQLEVLEEAQTDVLTQISQLIANHPYTPIIESLPIKSTIWTATLIGVIGDVHRFHNYGQFRAYVGWFPRVELSGSSVHSSRLSPKGARLARNVFGQMAMTLMTPNVRETPFRLYSKSLTDRGMKPIKALGHLSGKLASVLYCCLKTNTLYDENIHRKQMSLPQLPAKVSD